MLISGKAILDRYEPIAPIGRGGLSLVYRGRDTRLPRDVCIKVFHALARDGTQGADAMTGAALGRFVQEAYSLCRLNHPNTLRIYDFGYIEDPQRPGASLPVQVSEFLDGGTLHDVVRQRGCLRPDEALPIVEALGGALTEAHEAGIIHRDVKPKNILFGQAGQIRVTKLADFNIAKHLTQELELSETDAALNQRVPLQLLFYSLNWAAPEQIRGEEVVPASDVYALAAVLAYMLSGRRLFSAARRRAALIQRAEATARISKLATLCEIPRPLIPLLQRACSATIAQRPATANAFVDELRSLNIWQPGGADNAGYVEEDLHTASTAVRRVTTLPLTVVPDPDAPPARQRGTRPTGEAATLVPFGEPFCVGERDLRFVDADADGAELRIGPARVRTALMTDARGGVLLHVKGLNCFVRAGRRPPSAAVQLDRATTLELVSASSTVVARGRVQFGQQGDGTRTFELNRQTVGLRSDACRWMVAMDFGAPEDCLILYADG